LRLLFNTSAISKNTLFLYLIISLNVNYNLGAMKKLIMILLAGFVFACGQNKNKISINDFKVKAKELLGQNVIVEGKVSHVCMKSFNKLFLETAKEGSEVKCITSDIISKFDTTLMGKNVVIEGKVIDETLKKSVSQKHEENVQEGKRHQPTYAIEVIRVVEK
jgi:hypothetical protein